MKPYHDQTNLRLEIETVGTALANLVKNPSGEKGGWFWVTPTANTTMAGESSGPALGEYALTFTTTVSQACNFTTDFMPVSASDWVALRLDIIQISGSHNVKVTFDWYNSSKVLLSSSTQSGALSTTGTNYAPERQAPASTAYVKARLNFYNGAGNPSAAAFVTFERAMVTRRASSGLLTAARTNLLRNPSFETNATYWISPLAGATASRTTAQAAVGTACGQVSRTSPAAVLSVGYWDTNSVGTVALPVTAGTPYTFQLRVRSATVARSARVTVIYQDAGSVGVGTFTSPAVTTTTTGWTTLTFTTTAPVGATKAAPGVEFLDVATSEVHYFDAALFEGNATLDPDVEGGIEYFDGATTDPPNGDNAWTGTANASTSTGPFSFAAPTVWRNILGPTFEIGITRNALDLGTLTAGISDATLDPAETDDVRPGRLVRVQTLLGASGWSTLYEGKLTKALVTYERNKETNKETTIVALAAVDNVATLANRLEARGVAAVAALPFLLEGKGVPWNCNGSGNQVTSATIVSSNENAAMIDQVALTRDTVLGYAWVDRANVLQVWDTASLPASVAVTYTDVASVDPAEDGYSGIDADFDTDRCINEVMVKWLRYNAATGATEEILYGPYRDQSSIDTWGAFSAEFTIHGVTESAATIAAYAASILAANATPERRANSIAVPVVDFRSLVHATKVDLYSLVHVTFSTKVDEDYRVTGIKHTITPKKWMVGYSFDVSGSVAAPQVTPSPPTGRVDSGYAVRRLVTGTRTSNTTASASAYNIVTATIPYPVNGARYRVHALTNVALDSAGGFHDVQVKHGASASTGGTQVGQFTVDHRLANRRQGAALVCEFTYTGTTGAANYNVVLVGEPNSGNGNAVATSTNPSILTVDEIG